MAIRNRVKSRPHSSIPSVRRLLFATVVMYGTNIRRLTGIAVVVALPYALIGLVTSSSPNETISAYGSLIALVMNLAIIWSVMRLEDNLPINLRAAYYTGTSQIISFFLILCVLILELIPVSIGAVFYSNATIGSIVPITTPERLLVGLLWLLLALPSFYLLNRTLFAIFAVNDSRLSPVASLRASWIAVKGRSWAVFGRIVAITGLVMLITLIPTVVVLLLLSSRLIPVGLALLQLFISLFLLPILYLYLYKLYRSLDQA